MKKPVFTIPYAAGSIFQTSHTHHLPMIPCRVLAALLWSICAYAQAPASRNEFVIRNARIFDGSRVIGNGDVWVRNGLIEGVGSGLSVPPGIRTTDGAERTLVPGLIDAHVHTMGQDKFLKSALALGVTTELDIYDSGRRRRDYSGDRTRGGRSQGGPRAVRFAEREKR